LCGPYIPGRNNDFSHKSAAGLIMAIDQQLVSIIIPAYNAAEFIVETLENALALNWKNKEIIVVDDGSTDHSAELIRPFVDRIHYLFQENQGPSKARNTGIHYSHGDYYLFLDADDLVDPNLLDIHINHLQSHPKVDISYCWWQFIDENGKRLPEENHYQASGNLLADLILYNRFPIMAAVVRKRVLDKIGGFDEENRAEEEDWDFWMRAAANNCIFDNIPLPLVHYRLHKSNRNHKAPGIKVVEKIFYSVSLPPQILKMKPAAYASSYVSLSAYHYRTNHPEDAIDCFYKAVEHLPEIIIKDETFYTFICSQQPPGFRDTFYFKDMGEADRRVNLLLEKVFKRFVNNPSVMKYKQQAVSMKEMVFARHFYQQGDNRLARKHIYAAIQASPLTRLNRATAGLLLRSFIGQSRLMLMKSWFRAVSRT
jgi:glycosyltransferase involved in cell wall biosynthesis